MLLFLISMYARNLCQDQDSNEDLNLKKKQNDFVEFLTNSFGLFILFYHNKNLDLLFSV